MSGPRIPYVAVPPNPYKRRRKDISPPSSPEQEEYASDGLSPSKKRRLSPDETEETLCKKTEDITMSTPRRPSRLSAVRSSSTTAVPTPSSSRSMSVTDSRVPRPKGKGKQKVSTIDVYEPPDDELKEKDTEVPGETFDDEDDSQTGATDVPVRLLKDFSIYDANLNFVALNVLLQIEKATFHASGLVKAKSDEDNDEDIELPQDDIAGSEEESEEDRDIEPVRLKLGPIQRIDLHHWDGKEKRLSRRIYLLTEVAWYLLEWPSDAYSQYFEEFFINQQLCHLMVWHAYHDDRLTLTGFRDLISGMQDGDDFSSWILGRPLRVDELDSAYQYIFSLAPDLCRRMEFDMASRPLLVEYGVSEFPADSDSDMESVYDDTGSSVRAPRSRAKKTTSKKTDDIPYATPTVEAICKTLFRHKFQVSQNSSERGVDDQVKRNRQKVKAHDSDPETLAWGAQVDVTAADGVYYRSVTIDGELYQPGDVVVVFPEKDVRPCSSKNIYAKTYWFCRICYFFEDKESKMFHAQWFDHSSRTLLQELGHSKALFLLQSCEDLKLATIVQKVHVDYIRDCDAKEPEDRTNVDADEEAISDEVNSSDFFCSYVHCPTEQSFLDLPTLAEEQALLRQVPAHHPCTACALKEQGNALGLISIITPGKAMVVFGEEYHRQDVVYLENPLSDLLDIAQIVSLPRRDSGDNDRATVEVRFLRRMDKKARLGLKEAYIAQDRHLRLSSRTKPALIKNIQGHCFVRNAAEMTNEELALWATSCPDHFYLQDDESAEDFGNCNDCLQSHIDALEARQDLEKTVSPLRGMELFAGAGGLGTGMNLSNFVEAKWAVEFMPSAAKTYEANHPKTQVFCQDVGKLLKHAVDFEHTDKPGKLQSLLDGRVSPLPRRGEVDILSGGPPCQAFSRANHCPNADDIRATLPMTMLSYVEFYAPKYFLLENVTGLLGYRLLGRPKAHGKSLEGGVEMGLPKLICRILMSLGYQVQFKVLQAGHYGAPQDRRRVIILGSRRGVPMPKFPQPTHAFGRMPRYNCPGVIADPTDEKKKRFLRIEPVTRSRNPEDITMCAPLRPITVNDAISDLAEFDWETPYHKLTRTPARLAVDRERRDLGIPAFCAVTKKKDHNDAVGYELVTYLTPPQTAYQKLMREAGLRKVSHHETSAYSVDVVEVSVNVPLEKGADYRGIPTALFTERFRKEKNKKNGVVLFGRLDANDSFKTAMTGVAPNASGSILLHPSQKRILTVREAARAQGFPDSYQFLSVAERKGRILKDQYKQIGNAVPIPLALALGRCIGEAEIKCLEAERKERDRSPSPSV